MVSRYVLVGIVVGIFFAGIVISYAIFSNGYNNDTDTNQMKFGNQQDFDQMMLQNPKMAQQWIDAKQQQEMKTSVSGGDNPNQKGLMKKQQMRNQVGLMIQDKDLGVQIREEILDNTLPSSETKEEIIATGKSSDDSILVQIKSSTPQKGQFLELIETFHDRDGDIVEHVNHGIHVMQDGQTVLKMSELHSHHGEVTYWTRELKSDSPIEVEVIIYGLGMKEILTGPINDVVTIIIPS